MGPSGVAGEAPKGVGKSGPQGRARVGANSVGAVGVRWLADGTYFFVGGWLASSSVGSRGVSIKGGPSELVVFKSGRECGVTERWEVLVGVVVIRL